MATHALSIGRRRDPWTLRQCWWRRGWIGLVGGKTTIERQDTDAVLDFDDRYKHVS